MIKDRDLNDYSRWRRFEENGYKSQNREDVTIEFRIKSQEILRKEDDLKFARQI